MDKDADTKQSAASLSTICASGLDAIVIGAGVGGAAAAIHLARRLGPGNRVLLVERCAWPRAKVCGCCLNNAAVTLLEELDIASGALHEHGTQLSRVEVRCGHRAAGWAIPNGLVIPRDALDSLLVQRAMSAGVVFLPQCGAKVIAAGHADEGARDSQGATRYRVALRTASDEVECAARMIIVAEGLAGSALDAVPEFRTDIRPGSWIGLGGVVGTGSSVPPGTIGLHIGAHGYVGLVRLNDGMVNLAAAIDPAWVKRIGSPERATRTILDGCGVTMAQEDTRPWKLKGTAMLTRRRSSVAAPGLLVIGDAASYVEPFTGEGMTWALASAKAAAELTAETILGGREQSDIEAVHAWQRWHDSTISGRQLTSRMVRAITHRPALVGVALSLLRGPPWRGAVAASIARRLSVPYPRMPRLSGRALFPGAAA